MEIDFDLAFVVVTAGGIIKGGVIVLRANGRIGANSDIKSVGEVVIVYGCIGDICSKLLVWWSSR